MIKFVFFMLLFSHDSSSLAESLNKCDSTILASRSNAERILDCFDAIYADKMLFTADDKNYYVIINNTPCYMEYYVSFANDGSINKVCSVSNQGRTRKEHQELSWLRKILKKAEPIFDFKKYEYGYDFTKAKHTEGRIVYFILKDKENKTIAEYQMPVISIPSPVDLNLLIYMMRRLTLYIFEYE